MGLDFQFTEEQELFRKSLKEYFAKNITPHAKTMLKERMITPIVHKAYVDQGLFGLLIPQDYGGSGTDYLTFTLAVEEMTKGDPSGVANIVVWYAATCARIIANYANADLKDELLPKIVREGWMTPMHSTEPGAGTDFTAIAMTAKKEEDSYVLNGEKQCVTGTAEVMKYGGGFIVSAKTRPELGSKGMSLFYIPRDAQGMTTTIYEGMGVDLGAERFENTKVPETNLIGFEGAGYQLTYESFVHARVPTTMSMIAAAELCLSEGMEYLKQRKAFGRPLAGHEGPQFELAEHYARIQGAKLLCYKAAWLIDQYHKGKASFFDAMLAGSTAKLVASEDCVNAVSDILEWYGGLGTTTEYSIQQAFRSIRQAVVAEGTKSAQKIVIALQLLGRDFAAWRKWE